MPGTSLGWVLGALSPPFLSQFLGLACASPLGAGGSKGGWPWHCHSGSRAESLPRSGDASVRVLLGFIHSLSAALSCGTGFLRDAPA